MNGQKEQADDTRRKLKKKKMILKVRDFLIWKKEQQTLQTTAHNSQESVKRKLFYANKEWQTTNYGECLKDGTTLESQQRTQLLYLEQEPNPTDYPSVKLK